MWDSNGHLRQDSDATVLYIGHRLLAQSHTYRVADVKGPILPYLDASISKVRVRCFWGASIGAHGFRYQGASVDRHLKYDMHIVILRILFVWLLVDACGAVCQVLFCSEGEVLHHADCLAQLC